MYLARRISRAALTSIAARVAALLPCCRSTATCYYGSACSLFIVHDGFCKIRPHFSFLFGESSASRAEARQLADLLARNVPLCRVCAVPSGHCCFYSHCPSHFPSPPLLPSGLRRSSRCLTPSQALTLKRWSSSRSSRTAPKPCMYICTWLQGRIHLWRFEVEHTFTT